MGQTLFNTFINNIAKGIEHTIIKVGDDTMLSGAVDSPKGRDVIQMEFDRLEE